jgi:uncharacterized membrane protein
LAQGESPNNATSTGPLRRSTFRIFQSVRSLGVRLGSALTDPFLLAVLAGVGLYSWYWSQLTISRFYAMHAAVYDLGAFMEQTWLFTQPQIFSQIGYVGAIFAHPVQAILSPLAVIDSYPLILSLQSVALGAGAVPLYVIARTVLSSRPISLLVSSSYLLYSPMAGVNWFDVHFIAFFIPLFLTGYALYLHKHWTTAVILLFLAATTEYPAVLFVVLFAFTLVAQGVTETRLFHRTWDRTNRRFAVILLAATVAYFVYQFLYLGGFNITSAWQALVVTGHTPQQPGPAISIENRLIVVSLLLAPLLFLPLASWRWLILIAPFLGLVFFSEFFEYGYPYILQNQYPAVFVPFAFLGAIYSLAFLTRIRSVRSSNLKPSRTPQPRLTLWRRSKGTLPTALAISIFVSTSLFATAYQPYGPLNSMTEDSFDLGTNTLVNQTYFNEVQSAIGLVPRDTPYLLFQNDMPTALPRTLSYFQTPLVSGIDDWQNVSSYDAEQNSFPLITPLNVLVNAKIDYLVDAPYSWGFTEQGTASNDSMFHFVRTLYESGDYGVLGDVGGNLVLERGYDQPPIAYQPYRDTIPASSMWQDQALGPSGEPVLSVSNLTAGHAWDGPFFFLSPGWYTANFSLMTTDNSHSNYITLFAMADYGRTVFTSTNVTGSDFAQVGQWETFQLKFYVNDTYDDVGFPGLTAYWNGTLSLRSVQLTQVAPPSPVFNGS